MWRSASVTPLTLPFDVPYWLTVAVNADAEMTPRQQVLASPYALQAASAEGLAAAATVGGAQITGSISSATLPVGNLSGTLGTAQIANNAVTQAKLSPSSGGTTGKVLGTDGTNLVWQSVGGGTVTSVGATAPLASSGGTTPTVSLTGSIPVANGGTGQTTLTSNGVLIGQGAGCGHDRGRNCRTGPRRNRQRTHLDSLTLARRQHHARGIDSDCGQHHERNQRVHPQFRDAEHLHRRERGKLHAYGSREYRQRSHFAVEQHHGVIQHRHRVPGAFLQHDRDL